MIAILKLYLGVPQNFGKLVEALLRGLKQTFNHERNMLEC